MSETWICSSGKGLMFHYRSRKGIICRVVAHWYGAVGGLEWDGTENGGGRAYGCNKVRDPGYGLTELCRPHRQNEITDPELDVLRPVDARFGRSSTGPRITNFFSLVDN